MFFRYFYSSILQLVRVVLMFFRYFYSSISAASEGGANVFQVFL